MEFVLADLSDGLPGQRPSMLEDLRKLIETPPRCMSYVLVRLTKVLHTASIRLLMRHMFRILSSIQPEAHTQELLELCSRENAARTSSSFTMSPTGARGGDADGLRAAIWGDEELDGKRLRLVLAIWCAVSLGFAGNSPSDRSTSQSTFSGSKDDFRRCANSTFAAIQRDLTAVLIRWVAKKAIPEARKHRVNSWARISLTPLAVDSSDRHFVQLLVNESYKNGAALADITEEIITLSVGYSINQAPADLADTEATERCLACGQGVVFDELFCGKCSNGHEWGEQSSHFMPKS